MDHHETFKCDIGQKYPLDLIINIVGTGQFTKWIWCLKSCTLNAFAPVGIFSENSSDLVAPPFPYIGWIVNSTDITTNIDDCQSRVIVPVKQSGTIWWKGLTVCFSICNCGIVATLWSAASSRKSFLDGKGFNQEDDEDDDITHLRRIMKIMWWIKNKTPPNCGWERTPMLAKRMVKLWCPPIDNDGQIVKLRLKH